MLYVTRASFHVANNPCAGTPIGHSQAGLAPRFTGGAGTEKEESIGTYKGMVKSLGAPAAPGHR